MHNSIRVSFLQIVEFSSELSKLNVIKYSVKLLFSCVTVALYIGCASIDVPRVTPQELAVERQLQLEHTLTEGFDQIARIHNLLWPLLERNTDFCRGMTTRSIGLRHTSPRGGSGQSAVERRARDAVFDFNERPVIYAVAEGSPADTAGLKPNDRIVAVGRWTWTAENASDFNRSLQRRLDAMVRRGDVVLAIERDGERMSIDMTPIRICNVDLSLKPTLEVQARTNGREIVVTLGMAERLDDEQIRTVLAHELAHCTMGHITRTSVNSGLGLMFDLAFLTQRVWLGGVFSRLSRDAMSISIEREADYVSMYLLANAGFDTSDRAQIWRELADEVTFRSSFFTTHPYSPERYLLLTKTHDEIDRKRESGEDVVPNGMRLRRR
ncbi:MAG: M48 family metallopeptidase [Gammaproteobacteria bacterium]|nr:M48 family metallopeptidase [Gammaproteobacteria bacterium]